MPRTVRQERRRLLVMFFATNVGRFVLLILVVAGTGLLAGLALGLPLTLAARNAEDVPELDHASLAELLTAEDALIQEVDLPEAWVVGGTELGAFSVMEESWCNQAISMENLKTPVGGSFSEPVTGGFVIGEAVEGESVEAAGSYLQNVTRSLTACDEYTPEDVPENRLRITDDGETPPITSYITRRILYENNRGVNQVVTYMQVGDVIVVVEYLGSAEPPGGLMEGIERSILDRLVPGLFADDETDELPGVELPEDTIVGAEDDLTATTVIETGSADEGPASTEAPADTSATASSAPAQPSEG